jgi:RNA polymerase sigma-70 factor, ECF subfamily
VIEHGASSLGDALSRAHRGDALAFAEIVRQQQRGVYSLALRMLADRHKAEDLAQEVFLQLHRKLTVIESDAHLVFWLRKVTMNLAIDRLRQEPRYEFLSLEDDPGLPSDAPERDPLLQRLLRGLIAQLPAAARATVILRYQEDLDPVEIAAVLDMPLNTVKSHLKRSLAFMRDKLASATVGGFTAANDGLVS